MNPAKRSLKRPKCHLSKLCVKFISHVSNYSFGVMFV